jgi:amino acid transporter
VGGARALTVVALAAAAVSLWNLFFPTEYECAADSSSLRHSLLLAIGAFVSLVFIAIVGVGVHRYRCRRLGADPGRNRVARVLWRIAALAAAGSIASWAAGILLSGEAVSMFLLWVAAVGLLLVVPVAGLSAVVAMFLVRRHSGLVGGRPQGSFSSPSPFCSSG